MALVHPFPTRLYSRRGPHLQGAERRLPTLKKGTVEVAAHLKAKAYCDAAIFVDTEKDSGYRRTILYDRGVLHNA
jgi:hypothetical protein